MSWATSRTTVRNDPLQPCISCGPPSGQKTCPQGGPLQSRDLQLLGFHACLKVRSVANLSEPDNVRSGSGRAILSVGRPIRFDGGCGGPQPPTIGPAFHLGLTNPSQVASWPRF